MSLEDVTPVPPLPAGVVETQQRSVYSDVGALFVDFVSIAGAHSRD